MSTSLQREGGSLIISGEQGGLSCVGRVGCEEGR